MKPNGPLPLIQPMVVARDAARATNTKIVPWIRSNHRPGVMSEFMYKYQHYLAVMVEN